MDRPFAAREPQRDEPFEGHVEALERSAIAGRVIVSFHRRLAQVTAERDGLDAKGESA